ncbi:hypothetical protein RFN28_00850 [Mesorhizobium sp. VK24D]|uniref:Arc-like DNA binding domain-containing protein n=1 Tax=Mesorhizobium album TaxID=3072314 RepID=A0ABU4XQJ8_9HYPH|nr:hypothetical protein [Mesorhizobium sp. VK24D]MDX8477019.1 hypothetical protein [Mesorhizobium sp. VK24D]
MTEDGNSQSDRPMLIRFPPGSDLRQRLADSAHANRRTLTAEVISLLEMGLSGVEARLHAQEKAINTAHDLGSDLNDMVWDLFGRVERLESHCGIVDGDKVVPTKPKGKRR